MSSSSSSESDEAITIRQALYDAIGVHGWLTRQIAAAAGVTAFAIFSTLHRAGLDVTALRNVRCLYCGALLRGAHRRTGYGIHACPRPDCRRHYARDVQRRRRGSMGATGATGSTARLPEATVRAVLARKGQASERTVAQEYGISRSAVNGLWRGVRRRELARGETEGSAPA